MKSNKTRHNALLQAIDAVELILNAISYPRGSTPAAGVQLMHPTEVGLIGDKPRDKIALSMNSYAFICKAI